MAGLPQLVMVRASLEGLTSPQLPEGYELRHFRAGDEKGWNRLMDAAFGRPPGETDFAHSMAADPVYLPERVKLIAAADRQIVATASSWLNDSFGGRYGMLHWVGTHPDHAGKRLGAAVSIAAMLHARSNGLAAMALFTDDYRSAAVVTYLRLGFEPCCTHVSHSERWKRILEALSWHQHFDDILNGPLVRLDGEST